MLSLKIKAIQEAPGWFSQWNMQLLVLGSWVWDPHWAWSLLSIYLSIYPSICLSIYLSIYLSIHPSNTDKMKVSLNTSKALPVSSPEITVVMRLVICPFYTLTFMFTLLEIGTFAFWPFFLIQLMCSFSKSTGFLSSYYCSRHCSRLFY